MRTASALLGLTLWVTGPVAAASSGPIAAPLKILASNPHYFTDGSGKAVYLTGSHTWNNLQDWSGGSTSQILDFTAYVNMMTAHNQNFTLLWRTELSHFCGLPTGAVTDYTVFQQPWQRTGPGTATDGGLKYDLTQFDQSFFDRLRARVQQLNAAGIYAGVYLFTGEWVMSFRCGNDGYALTGANNINGIDDGGGAGSVSMTSPNAVTAAQDALVDKMIDTLNDLPNVLWIVSEEAPSSSLWWNNHVISNIRTYEGGKPLQHPIGYAAVTGEPDSVLYDSNADWVAPFAKISPTSSCGSGSPACKVNLNDSDHSYFGIWNDSPQTNRNYFWENFTNGSQTLFMDPYEVYYPRENRNLCASAINGVCSAPDSRWNNVRDTMGYIRTYANRMDLAAMTPQGNLSSTNDCLANAAATGAEYLVYAPSGGAFSVDLSSTHSTLNVEWFNPATGTATSGGTVAGGGTQSFTPPFDGDATLYLKDSGAAPPSVPARPTGLKIRGASG